MTIFDLRSNVLNVNFFKFPVDCWSFASLASRRARPSQNPPSLCTVSPHPSSSKKSEKKIDVKNKIIIPGNAADHLSLVGDLLAVWQALASPQRLLALHEGVEGLEAPLSVVLAFRVPAYDLADVRRQRVVPRDAASLFGRIPQAALKLATLLSVVLEHAVFLHNKCDKIACGKYD